MPGKARMGRQMLGGGAGGSALTEPVSPSPVQAMGIKTALPAAELGLYSLVLSGALAYAGQGLLEASQGNSWALGRGRWDPSPGGLAVQTSKARHLEAPDPGYSFSPGGWAEPGAVTGRHRRRGTDRDWDTENPFPQAASPFGAGMGECVRGPPSLRPHSVLRWGSQEGLPGVRETRLGIHRSEDGRSSQGP